MGNYIFLIADNEGKIIESINIDEDNYFSSLDAINNLINRIKIEVMNLNRGDSKIKSYKSKELVLSTIEKEIIEQLREGKIYIRDRKY